MDREDDGLLEALLREIPVKHALTEAMLVLVTSHSLHAEIALENKVRHRHRLAMLGEFGVGLLLGQGGQRGWG